MMTQCLAGLCELNVNCLSDRSYCHGSKGCIRFRHYKESCDTQAPEGFQMLCIPPGSADSDSGSNHNLMCKSSRTGDFQCEHTKEIVPYSGYSTIGIGLYCKNTDSVVRITEPFKNVNFSVETCAHEVNAEPNCSDQFYASETHAECVCVEYGYQCNVMRTSNSYS
eukprot:UN31907